MNLYLKNKISTIDESSTDLKSEVSLNEIITKCDTFMFLGCSIMLFSAYGRGHSLSVSTSGQVLARNSGSSEILRIPSKGYLQQFMVNGCLCSFIYFMLFLVHVFQFGLLEH